MIKRSVIFVGLWFCLSLMQFSFAAITLNTTRVLFDATMQEKVIKLTNNDGFPVLAQSWISKDEKRSKDFLITPPLFRLEKQSVGDIRIVKTSQNIPTDRESLYWINVKTVQPNDPNAQNTLAFSINTKIKMIYRPEVLMDDKKADSAYTALTFSINNKHLIVNNPTPYYILTNTIKLGNQTLSVKNGYIAPFSQVKLFIPKAISKYEVSWSASSVEGGSQPLQTKQIR